MYLGPKDDFAAVLLSQEGVIVKTIFAGKVRRYFGILSFFQNLVDILFKIPVGFFQSFFYLLFIFPDLIFSKGGYGSLPVVFAGWLFTVPIFLHESDTSPGMANRIMKRFAIEIFVSFPIEKTENFSSQKMISAGNPIRSELLGGNREEAKKLLNFVGGKPAILVLGGSQGSQRINDILLLILPEILKDFELFHQTGMNNFKSVSAEAKVVADENLLKYYHPFPFLKEEELKQAFVLADLIISRSGSGSIFEIAASGKPAVLVPLPESAQNHQIKNAYTYAKTQAGIVIEESNLTPHFFLERIKYLFSRPQKLKEMAEQALAFSRPKSAKIIAEYMVSYLTQ